MLWRPIPGLQVVTGLCLTSVCLSGSTVLFSGVLFVRFQMRCCRIGNKKKRTEGRAEATHPLQLEALVREARLEARAEALVARALLRSRRRRLTVAEPLFPHHHIVCSIGLHCIALDDISNGKSHLLVRLQVCRTAQMCLSVCRVSMTVRMSVV